MKRYLVAKKENASSVKRQKPTSSPAPSRGTTEGRHARTHGADSPSDETIDEGDLSGLIDDKLLPHLTDVESALPPVPTAIDYYESSQPRPEQSEETLVRLQDRKWVKGKSSIYVDAFHLALNTVLDEERHLFDAPEQAIFRHWRGLSYEAQYLYVRLFLRKTSAWHRLSSLKHYEDVVDLKSASAQLQLVRSLPDVANTSSQGEIELSLQYSFAQDSSIITTLDEASTLLKLDELRPLAKEARASGRNKQDLVNSLPRVSKSQVGLGSLLRRSSTELSIQSHSSAASDADGESDHAQPHQNRDVHFVSKILAETGPCIRLSGDPLKLFERVHLVFYRSTEWTEISLTTIILARMSKRNFPEYIVSRSASVFETRKLLLEFEKALRLQFTMDKMMETNWKNIVDDLPEVMAMYHEIFPRWKDLVQSENAKEKKVFQSGEGAYLRRLNPAWVYTRLLHKIATIFGKAKMRQDEHVLLSVLLSQNLFHHARRGAWYQRKALIEEHYMADITNIPNGATPDMQLRHWKKQALTTCENGVRDPLVHIIHHYDLYKRLSKLERACRVPKREQHDFSHVKLSAPIQVTIYGIRKKNIEPPPLFEGLGPPPKSMKSTKTIWVNEIDGGECSVEDMCLNHYKDEGWKGFHCEGGMMRTLFAYLLFDVLFVYVPNVFQTPFQTCPLDLHTDAFYPCRMSEITHRLVEIENGKAAELVRKVWVNHSATQTCVIGLDWSYKLDDLIEICGMFEGQALATICKVLAQDYSSRGGGMPDLFLWHPTLAAVKFVEVKSENDRLSDTQRLWIDVLCGAGLRVELCHALERGG